jgi:hypothetical protein
MGGPLLEQLAAELGGHGLGKGREALRRSVEIGVEQPGKFEQQLS